MQDLRIVLIILGILVTAGILAHGLWTSRRGKYRPLKNKPLQTLSTHNMAEDETQSPATMDRFDADGVGEVRVVQTMSSDPMRREPKMGPVDGLDDASLSFAIEEQQGPELDLASDGAKETESELTPSLNETEAGIKTAIEETKIDLEAQPQGNESVSVDESSESELSRGEAEDVQWQDIYVINVMAKEHDLVGEKLLPSLNRLGFKFGEMEIFHRHENRAGQGQVLFSLVNMVKPGTFDPREMSDFTTPGISLFMQLPKPGYAERVYRLMHGAANTLARELNGTLVDKERRPLESVLVEESLTELKSYDQHRAS